MGICRNNFNRFRLSFFLLRTKNIKIVAVLKFLLHVFFLLSWLKNGSVIDKKRIREEKRLKQRYGNRSDIDRSDKKISYSVFIKLDSTRIPQMKITIRHW